MFGKSIQSGCYGPLACLLDCYVDLSNVKKVFVKQICTIIYIMVFFRIMDALLCLATIPNQDILLLLKRHRRGVRDFFGSLLLCFMAMSKNLITKKAILHSNFLSNGSNNVMHT